MSDKSTIYCIIEFSLLISLLLGATAVFAKNTPSTTVSNSSYKKVSIQGSLLAKEISRTTGIAMNPLLCISALGAYGYYNTDENKRSALPWHLSPKFWGPLSLIMALIFLKDSSKVAVPKILTIPLDAIETLIEKNVSGLIALPVLFSAFSNGEFEQIQLLSQHTYDFLFPAAFASDTINTAINTSSSTIATIITAITVFIIYLIVWVVSQAFNVLILLCPFSTIDALLAIAKNSVVAIVIGLSNTYIGLILSIIIIGISAYLFPKGLRLVVFGTMMSYDIIVYKLLRKTTHENDFTKKIFSFSSCYLSNVPPLTYGAIHQHKQNLYFTYRSFYVLKEKTCSITGINTIDCELGNGVLSPVLYRKESIQGNSLQLFRIRAKYCQHYERIADILGVTQAEEISIGKKIQEGFRWCKSLFKKASRLDTESFIKKTGESNQFNQLN